MAMVSKLAAFQKNTRVLVAAASNPGQTVSFDDLTRTWMTGIPTSIRFLGRSCRVTKGVIICFLGGKKCQKIVNIGAMRKDRAAQQRLFSGTILKGLTQPLNTYGNKYLSVLLLLLLFYPFVVPADLSQQAKSAAADGLTYSDSIDKKVRKIKIRALF
jgi:hypothetical protein